MPLRLEPKAVFVLDAVQAAEQLRGFGVFTRFSTPSSAEITALEAALPAFLAQNPQARAHQDVFEKYTFARQYTAGAKDGMSYIWANFYPAGESTSRDATRWFWVLDGGPYYWRVLYNVTKGRFEQLSFNQGS